MIERHKNNKNRISTIETMNSSAILHQNHCSRFSNNINNIHNNNYISNKKMAPSTKRLSFSSSSFSLSIYNHLVMSSKSIHMMALLAFVLLSLGTLHHVEASQRSIQLDSTGHYKGIVVGFSNDFKANTNNRMTVVKAIMDQMQNTSDIVKQLLGVQFGEVNIILPEDWNIVDALKESGTYNVDEAPFKPLKEADILFTDDDKEQILTMQYGECGEGALPINFPKKYISDGYSPRLLAHQWILYRYGVFNEFGYVNDNHYPVYFAPIDGGVRNQTKGIITSCANQPEFNYSSQCTNEPITIDPDTGRPVSPNCDVMPLENSIQSSFMYAPLAVSEYKLCDNKSHDHLSPNKQNVLCDYQSIQDVINKHADFDNYKPKSNSIVSSIRFRIWQSKKSFQKAHVMYALPLQNNVQYLGDLMKTIEQVLSNSKHFEHQVKFSVYNESRFQLIQDWVQSTNIPIVSPSGTIAQPIDLTNLLQEVIVQFQKSPESSSGGHCILFFQGSSTLLDPIDDDRLAENLNKANIALKVIIYGQKIPNKSVLKLFHQLTKKLVSSSVEYAFADSLSSSPAFVAIQNQIFSTLSTAVYDTLQDATEQTHILLKRETVRSSGDKQQPIKIDFTIDSTIDKNDVLIEMYTTGNPSDLAVKPRLIDSTNTQIRPHFIKPFENVAMILYTAISSGSYSFSVSAPETEIFTTISVRVLSNKGSHYSYKEAPVKAKCWLQTDNNPNFRYPLRGYVQVSQGLNGPVYDADVRFTVRRITAQQTETNISLNDNGKGSPDISAHDGIYSAYVDLSMEDSNLLDVPYTVTARVVSDKLTVKPGNFGNTIMFKNKPRCCGSVLNSRIDDETSGNFERVINCGSLFVSSEDSFNRVRNTYSIRDLQLASIEPDNRTISLEWNSPFLDVHKPNIIIKAFYSQNEHSSLPLEIKENFDQATDAEIELVPSEDERILKYEHSLYEFAVEHQRQLFPGDLGLAGEQSMSPGVPSQETPFDIKPAVLLSNSHRQAKIRILAPEEGFYFVAVKERDDSRQTKPSNIIAIYLKSNVPIENTTALAIDDSKLPEGTYRESLGVGPLTKIHILIICIGSALVLLIVVLLIICLTKKRRRQAGKNSQMEYKESLKNGMKKSVSLTENDKTDAKQSYYLAQDASSLQSNSVNNDKATPVPNSNLSNNTSCSSVNTVDQHGSTYHNSNENGSHNFEPTGHNLPNGSILGGTPSQHGLVQHPSINGLNHVHHPHHNADHPSNNQSNPNRVNELNVTTLMPNSWDAKELLDHWGRVQEAKQRQESPPVMRIQTASPSIPSYGGSSSLENYNHNHGYFGGIHQPNQLNGMGSMLPVHHHQNQQQPGLSQSQHPFGMGEMQSDFHQGPLLYSPYSNASSIWQHHQQQQQQQQHHQQQQLQQQPSFHHHPHQHVASPAYTITPMSSPGGYDDNGLPEYSVVRKVHHPNISQV